MSKYPLILFAVGLLAGCTQSAVNGDTLNDSQFMHYQCGADKSFDVAYLTESEEAVLRLPDNEYRLVQVRAGSGTKYILNDGTAELMNPVTLRTKGKEARLELGRVIYKNCKTQ
ncbi:MliC family protein [Vibrio paucivorans]